jgi:hypothetical protein
MLLIDDLLFLPFKGFKELFKKIADTAEEEVTDEGKVKEELMMAQMQFETDQIDQDEYEKREQQLLKRLDEIRIYKEGLK